MNRIVVAMALILLSVSSAFAQKGQFAAPPEAELGYTQYPIYPKVLTVPQMARLELTARELMAPTVVYNHYRGLHGKDGRFVLETLPVGTVVLVDKNGMIRYKADCGNRLVELKKSTEPVIASKSNIVTSSAPITTPPPAKVEDEGWAWFTNGLYRTAMGVLDGLKFVLDNFGWFLIILFIGMMIHTLITDVRTGRTTTPTAVPAGGNNAQQAVAEVPPTAPAPRTPDAPARETERTDGVPSTVYVNMGNDSRPHLLTWNRGVRSLSFTERPDGSHELRVDNRA